MEINLKDGGWICTTPIIDAEMRQYVYTLLIAVGIQVTGNVKDSPRTQEYPYIFLTSAKEGLNAGSDVYLINEHTRVWKRLTIQELLNLAAQQITNQTNTKNETL